MGPQISHQKRLDSNLCTVTASWIYLPYTAKSSVSIRNTFLQNNQNISGWNKLQYFRWKPPWWLNQWNLCTNMEKTDKVVFKYVIYEIQTITQHIIEIVSISLTTLLCFCTKLLKPWFQKEFQQRAQVIYSPNNNFESLIPSVREAKRKRI